MHALPSHPKSPFILAAVALVFTLLVMAIAAPDLSTLDASFGGSGDAAPASAESAPAPAPAEPTWATDPLASPLERLTAP